MPPPLPNPKLERHLAYLQAAGLAEAEATTQCFAQYHRDIRPAVLALLRPAQTPSADALVEQYAQSQSLAEKQALLPAFFGHFCPNPAYLAWLARAEKPGQDPSLDTETLDKLRRYRVLPSVQQVQALWDASPADEGLWVTLFQGLLPFAGQMPERFRPDLEAHITQAEGMDLLRAGLALLAGFSGHFQAHFEFWAGQFQLPARRLPVLMAMQKAQGLSVPRLFALFEPVWQEYERLLMQGQGLSLWEEMRLMQQVLQKNGSQGLVLRPGLRLDF